MCPSCGATTTDCSCGRASRGPAAAGPVRVGRQVQGRKGKGVTIVTGLPLATGELRQLAQALKKKCGTGGTVKEGVIEIQGDHRDLLVRELQARGWDARRSGG